MNDMMKLNFYLLITVEDRKLDNVIQNASQSNPHLSILAY